ncbi:cupin domain-containing protein [bacterium]|nr:cupin domain-containing protein [bacterium]
MKETAGRVFSAAADNAPLPGCTVSREIYRNAGDYAAYFSLAADTDISAEIYPYRRLLLVLAGKAEIYGGGASTAAGEGEMIAVEPAIPTGIRSGEGAVYLEIGVGRSEDMNKLIKSGEAFKLAELLPYSEGRIVNMDILSGRNMKFVIMSFAAGTGLSEHAAPGEAVIFALEGGAVIGYEGREHVIKAGENFCFAKGGLHYVKAEQNFKMALLLTLE